MSDTDLEPIQVTPLDFSQKAYSGIHLFENEHGEWFAYGHHDGMDLWRAVMARWEADGMLGEMEEFFPSVDDLIECFELRWANKFRRDQDGIWFRWCDKDADGAAAVTAVIP
jgi:hypothetical protein